MEETEKQNIAVVANSRRTTFDDSDGGVKTDDDS